MNVLHGEIKAIETVNNLSLVSVMVADTLLKIWLIDTPNTAPYLLKGNKVRLLFKETELVIGAKDSSKLSIENIITAEVKSVIHETLLSKLVLNTSLGNLKSIISTQSCKQLDIKTNTMVKAMIKADNIMLMAE